jgi:uncharacterized protein
MPAPCCAACATRSGTKPVIYLDTSALVKLIRTEAESSDLANWLDERTEMRWITSTLAEVELPRAIIRAGNLDGLAAVPAVLARLDRFEIDAVVRTTAAAYQDPALRSLDSIHLATASVAASVATLTAFVTYDSRLAEATRTLGMPTVAPGMNRD